MTTPATQPQTVSISAFPHDFLWGAATSAYQIEGATRVGGRGESVWDVFCRRQGKVADGSNGDVAVDHYHRYADDVALMARLGLGAYRFSVAWPRIQPSGRGQADRRGLDFYKRLCDELLEAGIQPWPTLYHWDLPQTLEEFGGWANRDTAARFGDYAALVHEALGDRVTDWTTVNEPWCAAFLGYASGLHAPGRREPAAAVAAGHHLMLAHGHAAQAIRARDGAARVGVALNLFAVDPFTGSAADADAARRVDGLQNRFFLDPVLLRRYPDDVRADLGAYFPDDLVKDGDLGLIGAPIDHLGVNYYSRHVVSAAAGDGAGQHGDPACWVGSEHVSFPLTGRPVTGVGWEIDQTGLSDVLLRLHREYPPVPVVVTENGAAFDDEVSPDGRVHDPGRTAYLAGHIGACAEAVAAGVPLRGYFVWSLLDNFEWAEGYGPRFGIVHVDFGTLSRTPKDSALWYADLIRSRG